MLGRTGADVGKGWAHIQSIRKPRDIASYPQKQKMEKPAVNHKNAASAGLCSGGFWTFAFSQPQSSGYPGNKQNTIMQVIQFSGSPKR
jgi:hypothetical protein